MLAPAALVFVLTFGMFAGVLSVVSFGTAPLWLLAGAPLLLSSCLAGAMLRAGTPEPVRSPARARFVHRATVVAERVELVFGFFLSFATIGLFVVLALPLHGRTENVAGAVAGALALTGAAWLVRHLTSAGGAGG